MGIESPLHYAGTLEMISRLKEGVEQSRAEMRASDFAWFSQMMSAKIDLLQESADLWKAKFAPMEWSNVVTHSEERREPCVSVFDVGYIRPDYSSPSQSQPVRLALVLNGGIAAIRTVAEHVLSCGIDDVLDAVLA
jgi:hypothetical protein